MTPLVVILTYLGEGEQYSIFDEPVRVALCSAQAHAGVGLLVALRGEFFEEGRPYDGLMRCIRPSRCRIGTFDIHESVATFKSSTVAGAVDMI